MGGGGGGFISTGEIISWIIGGQTPNAPRDANSWTIQQTTQQLLFYFSILRVLDWDGRPFERRENEREKLGIEFDPLVCLHVGYVYNTTIESSHVSIVGPGRCYFDSDDLWMYRIFFFFIPFCSTFCRRGGPKIWANSILSLTVFDQFKLSCLLFLPSWNCWPSQQTGGGKIRARLLFKNFVTRNINWKFLEINLKRIKLGMAAIVKLLPV